MKIRFNRDGKEIGEYPEDAVSGLLQSKFLRPNDLFWHEGLPGWTPVASRWSANGDRSVSVPATIPPLISSPAHEPTARNTLAQSPTMPIQVIVKDVEMSFSSMVEFMLKWAFASIPAAIVLVVIIFGVFVALTGILAPLQTLLR